jgi:glycogen debranching enzyme
MSYYPPSSVLSLLQDRIQLERVPFSDRGSRLLVYQDTRQAHALYIKLAERLTAVQPGLSIYRSRPPFIHSLQLIDEDGAALPFRATTYPHAVFFDTPRGVFTLAFQSQHVLAFGMPPGERAGLRFVVSPRLAWADAHGGEFKSVRNASYSTNGVIVRNDVSETSQGFEVVCVIEADRNSAITLNVQAALELVREVHPFRQTLADAEQRWQRWLHAPPDVAPELRSQYLYAWWIMGNNLLSPFNLFTREATVPSKVHYVGAWQWDNAFHALAYRHVDPTLAQDQIRLMLDHQLPNGMIPDAVYDDAAITHLDIPIAAAVTKPPVTAWAAMKVFAMHHDIQFLRDIYEPMVRWNSWWFGLNDDDNDGIVQYSHPFSSGLDDSPLWDYGMPVEAPDLNTYLQTQMQALSDMARLLGLRGEAEMWRRKAHALTQRMIEHFWDERAGLFQYQHQHQTISVKTPFSLLPLWTGELPPAIVERLLAHLQSPALWGEYPLATVARDDPHYDANQMWRGPVWINVNYLFVEALRRVNQPALARKLAEETLGLVLKQNDIYEYYNPDTGAPPPKAAPIFGWSAALFIDLAIQVSQNQL